MTGKELYDKLRDMSPNCDVVVQHWETYGPICANGTCFGCKIHTYIVDSVDEDDGTIYISLEEEE